MNEYIFFDVLLQTKFVEFVEGQGIACELSDDPLGFVVAIPEDIGDALEDEIEARYDELEREQKELLSHEAGGFQQLAGISFHMPDGESRMVPVPTELANRLLSVASLEEIQKLFDSVAHHALIEDHRTLCQVLHDEMPTPV